MQQVLKSGLSRFRLFLLVGTFAVLYGVLVSNLYNIQITKGDFYAARAESQYKLAGYLNPSRGSIYFTDKNNNTIPAAINKSYPTIFAVPKEVEDAAEVANQLAEMLGLDAAKLRDRLGRKNNLYELLIRKASDEQVRAVDEAQIKGVYVDNEDYRFYPFGLLGSQVLGYVGSGSDGKEVGRYGIEAMNDDFLTGTPGTVTGDTVEKATAGGDIQLTIDRSIQAQAEEILANLVKEFGATSGAVIVQEPATGKILAMGGAPTFDPNNYSQSPVATYLNPNVQMIYEPGSIFKIITMASALDAGKVTPDTAFYDTGFLTLNGMTVRNWDLKAHGRLTMTEVIEQSINTGAAFAERQLGHDNFYNYLLKFGMNDKTGIELPGELAGNLRNLKSSFREINFATASYGQGVSVTPLELINAVSAIANGGTLMKPYITADKMPTVVRRVIGKDASEKITRMMVSAVDKAKVAHIDNYEVAGKTGTALVADLKRGGYTDDVINTYAGYAPAFNPRFTILIKLDKPKGAPLAGATVVPAFRELAEFLLNYYNVPPDSTNQ